MKKSLVLVVIALLLVGCGRTGPLYLTPDYQKQHITPQQPVPPSDSLQPLQSNQRVIYVN